MLESRDLRSLCTREAQSRPARKKPKNNKYSFLISVLQQFAAGSLVACMLRPLLREEFDLKILKF